jgi:hypothetical protein
MMWTTGFIWLRIGSSVRLYENSSEHKVCTREATLNVSGRSKNCVFDGEIWTPLAPEESAWHYASETD